MILYHGSSKSGIKTLKPFPHKAVNGKKVTFATADKAYALSMIYGSGNELAVSYSVNPVTGKKEMYIDELKPGKLSLLDKEGYLYEVDKKYFERSPEELEGEYVSYKEVPVEKEVIVTNILSELDKLGVNLIKYDDVPESMDKRGKDPQKAEIEFEPDRFE